MVAGLASVGNGSCCAGRLLVRPLHRLIGDMVALLTAKWAVLWSGRPRPPASIASLNSQRLAQEWLRLGAARVPI